MTLADRLQAKIDAAAAPGASPVVVPTALSARLAAKLGPIHPNSRVAHAMASAGPSKTPEFLRVAALPRRELDLDAVPDLTPLFARPGGSICPDPKCPIKTLRPIQNAMLLEASQQNGLDAVVGVGFGKTLAALLLPLAMNSHRALLLVPPQMRPQLFGTDIPHLSQHFALPPIRDVEDWFKQVYEPMGRGMPSDFFGPPSGELWVMAYSRLSNPSASDFLDHLAPDLVVADEAQNLRNKSAARGRRFVRLFTTRPATRAALMSGTLMKGSLTDFSHFFEIALRKNSPVPDSYPDQTAWDIAIRGEGGEGALSLFCDEGEDVLAGFRRRVVETPGVVATSASALGTSLSIIEVVDDDFEPPPDVQKRIDDFEDDWSIAGREIDHAGAAAQTIRYLTKGFHYEWIWPSGVDQEWLDAKLDWDREVRAYLKRTNRSGMDSPSLLAAAAARGTWKSTTWSAWDAVRRRPGPTSVPVWDSDWLVDYIGNLLDEIYQTDTGLIIWTSDPPFGARLAEKIDVRYYGQGSDRALAQASPTTDQIMVCSIQAHGTGKNLQAWADNLIDYPMSNAEAWEQLLGRTHRPGQDADEVQAVVLLPTLRARQAWAKALLDARFEQEKTGQPQKLLYATRSRKGE